MNKFAIGSLSILCSALVGVPNAIAQMDGLEEPNDTRIEKYEDLTSESEMDSDMSQMDSMDSMESESMTEPTSETRTEETMQEAQSMSSDMSMYDVRRTEAFNLVSSAYRGDFEDQGIESYAVLISNYETGQLTAEDLIQAAIDAGELSPNAIEDDYYVQAVQLQLDTLTNN